MNNQCPPFLAGIEAKSPSYIGDGEQIMDKTDEEYLPVYSKGKDSVLVESCFSGTKSIKEIIKQIALEQYKPKIEVETSISDNYNDASDTVVVASTEEGSK